MVPHRSGAVSWENTYRLTASCSEGKPARPPRFSPPQIQTKAGPECFAQAGFTPGLFDYSTFTLTPMKLICALDAGGNGPVKPDAMLPGIFPLGLLDDRSS